MSDLAKTGIQALEDEQLEEATGGYDYITHGKWKKFAFEEGRRKWEGLFGRGCPVCRESSSLFYSSSKSGFTPNGYGASYFNVKCYACDTIIGDIKEGSHA